jgi:tol-pal system protein YbgF
MNKARLILAAALSLAAAAPAAAQRAPDVPQEAVPFPDVSETTNNKAIDRRLDRDEKALRQLRSIVLKAQAQGSPVEVVPAGPDPILTDMQSRLADMDAAIRTLTGQAETLRHDLAQARKELADAQAQIAGLNDRLAAAAPPPPAADAEAAGPPPQDAAAAPDNEAGDYQAARQILDSGDFAGGAAAMQAFIARYPNSGRVGTANYWAGRAYAALGRHAEAAAAFAKALKGWPKETWAGDAVVQLSSSLVALKRAPDACRALTEFDTRYAAKAAASTKALAGRVRAAAACG